jgi:hypothetical protein
MPYRVVKYQATPNPNALKVILDKAITDRPRSFRSREELDAAPAPRDPLAARFFAIDGVTSLLFSGDWLTVNKSPDAEWAPIKKAVERELAAIDGPES